MYLPDWALHWIHSIFNIYRYAGDKEIVSEYLSIAERVLRWFESFLGDDNLLHDVTGWALTDWASVYMNGCASTTNALWARGLNEFAEMSEWIGNAANANWAKSRHQSLKDAFEVFWDETRGVYIDHIVDGEPRPGPRSILAHWRLWRDLCLMNACHALSWVSPIAANSFAIHL
jgi:alpha-L-rhamnosidase